MLKIEVSNEGLYGAVNTEGQAVIPFVYDEITPVEDVYYCRIWKDYQIYDLNGKPKMCSRNNREWLNNQLASVINTTYSVVDSREGLEDVPFEEECGVLIKYENGKFGILSIEGKELLPCLYDFACRWKDCNVLYTRLGNTHRYFDLEGNQILKTYKVEPRRAFDEPYYLGEAQNDTALVVKQYVDSCYDDQCCIRKGRPFRLDRVPKVDIEKIFRENTEIKAFSKDAFEIFNGPDTYIYSEYIARTSSIDECIEDLVSMDCYRSSWYYIDKVLTNPNSIIDENELDKLADAAKTKGRGCYDYQIGYGIDNSLPDGVVKVMHIEFYAERSDWWNDPKPRKASAFSCDPTDE